MRFITMKKVIAAACIGTSVVFLSCGTTSNATNTQHDIQPALQETQIQESEKPKADPKDAAFEAFSKTISGLTLSVVQTPKEVIAGRIFTQPFSVKALHADGTPAEGLPLTVSYPAEKTAGGISFAHETVLTSQDGTASFTPPKTSFACNSVLSFAPAGDTSNKKIEQLIAEKTVTAPYKVKTNKMSTGGSIALVDFTKSGKPVSSDFASSSSLLMTLMKKGFVRIGNAPYISDVAYGDQEAVYKSAKKLFGSLSTFLVYGTVKYASEVEKTDSGYSLTIASEITAIDMKDGSVLYHTTKQTTATDTKEWNVINVARKNLADELADELLYNL